MSNLDEVMRISTDLEKFFIKRYNAKGRGLISLTKSLRRGVLSDECIENVRRIANIRNYAAHDNPDIPDWQLEEVRHSAFRIYALCGCSFFYRLRYRFSLFFYKLGRLSEAAEKGCTCLMVILFILFLLCVLICFV